MVLAAMLLAGCGLFGTEPEAKRVTIELFYNTNSPEYHDSRDLVERLKRKFPNVDFGIRYIGIEKMVGKTYPVSLSYKQYLDRGVYPDVILERVNGVVPQFVQEGLVYDHTPFIESAVLNLSRFQPEWMAQIRAWSPEDQIYALPYRSRVYGLFYDKSEMARRGVELRDRMTWDELLEIMRGGNDLDKPYLVWPALESQFRLRYVDPATNEAAFWVPSGCQSLYRGVRGQKNVGRLGTVRTG